MALNSLCLQRVTGGLAKPLQGQAWIRNDSFSFCYFRFKSLFISLLSPVAPGAADNLWASSVLTETAALRAQRLGALCGAAAGRPSRSLCLAGHPELSPKLAGLGAPNTSTGQDPWLEPRGRAVGRRPLTNGGGGRAHQLGRPWRAGPPQRVWRALGLPLGSSEPVGAS